jgi:catechol 2,3-dioxygenase-like lactoylglutathione lyase family enzyme
MPISHLEHFLIVSKSYAETCAWYIDNLGMQEGPHPDFGPGVEVTWLYLGDKDVVHIVPLRENDTTYAGPPVNLTIEDIAKGGRPIHHIAFRATDRAQMTARFKANGIPYIEQQANKTVLCQVFVRDPNGITVELNFPASEVDVDEELPVLSLKTN